MDRQMFLKRLFGGGVDKNKLAVLIQQGNDLLNKDFNAEENPAEAMAKAIVDFVSEMKKSDFISGDVGQKNYRITDKGLSGSFVKMVHKLAEYLQDVEVSQEWRKDHLGPSVLGLRTSNQQSTGVSLLLTKLGMLNYERSRHQREQEAPVVAYLP